MDVQHVFRRVQARRRDLVIARPIATSKTSWMRTGQMGVALTRSRPREDPGGPRSVSETDTQAAPHAVSRLIGFIDQEENLNHN